jgi:hypothetical protein
MPFYLSPKPKPMHTSEKTCKRDFVGDLLKTTSEKPSGQFIGFIVMSH